MSHSEMEMEVLLTAGILKKQFQVVRRRRKIKINDKTNHLKNILLSRREVNLPVTFQISLTDAR